MFTYFKSKNISQKKKICFHHEFSAVKPSHKCPTSHGPNKNSIRMVMLNMVKDMVKYKSGLDFCQAERNFFPANGKNRGGKGEKGEKPLMLGRNGKNWGEMAEIGEKWQKPS